ncbi:hypothetical protein PIROE2DRAFT_3714 [Piromyces sp. E2]|nr:hypothetical protein PIROE2DRAFT_3714 [Piromyces sp. E2]|eukprot:OUM68569.1 hypothetical protein PIROE2DRAFT_3714 [Piromyces sp. E2]
MSFTQNLNPTIPDFKNATKNNNKIVANKDIVGSSVILKSIPNGLRKGKLTLFNINNNLDSEIKETTVVNGYLQTLKEKGDSPLLSYYKSSTHYRSCFLFA